jgi:ring-1,2-phenylacetyl-CoA epoxidase subunit PaaB
VSDTQWPRFEVFQQERQSKPHQNVGSVHAPDVEMAMQNARDVFVRRPQAVNLWVVSAEAIFAKTAQELVEDPTWNQEVVDPAAVTETYYVFQKTGQRRAMVFVVHIGQVEAASAVQAMNMALEKYAGSDVFVWWVCPARAVTRSEDDNIESMFAPAQDKTYRMPNEYRTITQMMEKRRD